MVIFIIPRFEERVCIKAKMVEIHSTEKDFLKIWGGRLLWQIAIQAFIGARFS